jgi:adenine-specific DNA-methyltransferase
VWAREDGARRAREAAWHGHAKAKDKPAAGKRRIEQYDHKGKQREEQPTRRAGHRGHRPGTPQSIATRTTRISTPTLTWAGKAEHTSFEVPTVSLHVHERIDPKTIVEAVRRRNGTSTPIQGSLFESAEENPPLREAIDFYQHAHAWSNRLIAGDSLLVMNSLLEKEGMAGKVQMVYIDPPYGIRYGSNFQPFVNRRDVKDGSDEDLTQEPEMIRAFRDTWELGIHSYLTYLRDRLLLARELLHESGSCFVQISDENLHHVRALMDEVFGADNLAGLVVVRKTAAVSSPLARTNVLATTCDYLVWYARSKVLDRCILMTTGPGDLVFDPTCGSGTTAHIAEQRGRRWITCDTSRVAVTLTKQRVMTAVFDYYELAHPAEGVGSGSFTRWCHTSPSRASLTMSRRARDSLRPASGG